MNSKIMFLTHYYKYCGTIKEFKIDTNIVCTHICELICSYSSQTKNLKIYTFRYIQWWTHCLVEYNITYNYFIKYIP